MNVVRLLRSQSGVTQQTLAERAGTSQPTIALYESGGKSPTVATVQRLAAALGLELVVTYTPRMTREDRRSLAYHRVVAEKLRRDPVVGLKRAKETLEKMHREHPGTEALCKRWRMWLALPTEELLARLLDPGVPAREMRQVTPFAGVLTPKERAQILRQFRKESAA
ncbi:MAG: helix-turn-helix transcriptional regulator [Deltaproteobacteria bacterium]|nr:helix-turn-helix transcriptional regulator [Deltaproteobacteria bacterium]